MPAPRKSLTELSDLQAQQFEDDLKLDRTLEDELNAIAVRR